MRTEVRKTFTVCVETADGLKYVQQQAYTHWEAVELVWSKLNSKEINLDRSQLTIKRGRK